MSRYTTWIISGLVLLFLAVQFVPVDRTTSGAQAKDMLASPVDDLLARACYDCHSDLTRWPWYSRIAPGSWFVAHHVHEGREHLNLSAWNALSPGDRAHHAEEMVEEVEEGKMPLKSYTLLHAEAKLTAEEVTRLREWARTVSREMPGDDEGNEDRP